MVDRDFDALRASLSGEASMRRLYDFVRCPGFKPLAEAFTAQWLQDHTPKLNERPFPN